MDYNKLLYYNILMSTRNTTNNNDDHNDDNNYNHHVIESKYQYKFDDYINRIDNHDKCLFYPWYNNKSLLTPYHSIFIEEKYINSIRTSLLYLKILFVPHSLTYKKLFLT